MLTRRNPSDSEPSTQSNPTNPLLDYPHPTIDPKPPCRPTLSYSGPLGICLGIWDLGFGIWDLGFGIWDLGFGIWNLGFLEVPRTCFDLFIGTHSRNANSSHEMSEPVIPHERGPLV